MKIKAGTVTKEQDIAAEKTFLNVPWQILDDADAVVLEGAQAFGLDASQEEITDFLTRTLATYKENAANAGASIAAQAALDQAEATASAISGIEIN